MTPFRDTEDKIIMIKDKMYTDLEEECILKLEEVTAGKELTNAVCHTHYCNLKNLNELN